jgi:hypothetical protein
MKLWPKRFPTLEFANQYAKKSKEDRQYGLCQSHGQS